MWHDVAAEEEDVVMVEIAVVDVGQILVVTHVIVTLVSDVEEQGMAVTVTVSVTLWCG